MSVDRKACAPVLVLGLGNRLLADDGLGLELTELLERQYGVDARIEFVDGGTQGLALLGLLDQRQALLILDAVAFGAAPGSVHVVDDPLHVRMPRGQSAHEGNAGELLAAALLLGSLPRRVALVGIEPAPLRTHVGLSNPVLVALPTALRAARSELDLMLAGTMAAGEFPPCTN
jgi:hydrogenase maturation protease